jgi:hypothetical protein
MAASLCIAVSGTAAAVDHNFLKAGGVDDVEVAEAYYNTIDPDGLRTTQADWERENGFHDPRNTVVVAAGYFNEGDLAYWRRIEMVVDKRPGNRGNIAFTTVNYESEEKSLRNRPDDRLSVVNMEYSPGPDGDRITKFYVFHPETGARQTSTAFDSRNEQLFVPAACFSCHGGDDDAESPLSEYNDGSGETNATFLAFDINTMTFGNPPRVDLEDEFKKFNQAVLRTNPTRATRALINGLYGGSGLPEHEQVLSYMPSSWTGEEQLYHEVFVPECRSCHTTSDTKLNSLEWWKANTSKIREVVFHEQTMPNSMPSFERFWNSNQPEILDEALTRFETP